MFPVAEMDSSLFLPVTHGDFLRRILVPETALRLIMEDLELTGEEGTKEALKVLRESSEYGAGMFPDDDGGGGQEDSECMTVGDQIVMERARGKRRKVQFEGLQDASSSGQTGATMPSRPRPRPRPRTRKADRR